jgi:hypothetical protein
MGSAMVDEEGVRCPWRKLTHTVVPLGDGKGIVNKNLPLFGYLCDYELIFQQMNFILLEPNLVSNLEK